MMQELKHSLSPSLGQMAASKYLALAVLVLLANSIPTLAVLPQLCQHVSQLNPQDAEFCMKAGSLRELGCLW